MENYQMFLPVSLPSNMGHNSQVSDNIFHANELLSDKKTNQLAQVKEVAEDTRMKSGGGEYCKKEKKIKKPKYAFQTRSQVDILDDGFRWRKYGQKSVKNNKFPRSYYRCTHQGCNVKKQVQRLTKDETVVLTTYEGIHTHLLDTTTDNFQHILSQMQIYTPF